MYDHPSRTHVYRCKEGGWIGPKITGSFSRVASATPADDLVRSWAANLWEDWG